MFKGCWDPEFEPSIEEMGGGGGDFPIRRARGQPAQAAPCAPIWSKRSLSRCPSSNYGGIQ